MFSDYDRQTAPKTLFIDLTIKTTRSKALCGAFFCWTGSHSSFTHFDPRNRLIWRELPIVVFAPRCGQIAITSDGIPTPVGRPLRGRFSGEVEAVCK